MSEPVDPYARSVEGFQEPPRRFWETVRQLGPGLIIVGSVVGSGELIMTTILGAHAGFILLWFVLLSCFIKVVVQAELTRYTISSGKTFLDVFNALPGPAAPRPVWLTLSWMAVVVVASVVALTIYVKVDTGENRAYLGAGLVVGVAGVAILAARLLRRRAQGAADSGAAKENAPTLNWFLWLWLAATLVLFVNSGAILGGAGQTLQMVFPDVFGEGGSRSWAAIVAIAAAILLLSGSYALLEKLLIVLVATFTLLTVVCTVLLQWTGFAISWSSVEQGLTFGTPELMTPGVILTAAAMFAGTGIGVGEMWNYTYWCVEKGYARNVGERQPGEAWSRRARGWVRVMYADVFLTMVVYTISTVAFYFLGAAILHVKQLIPKGPETLTTLSAIYTESLGSWAATLFVVGAFFVLFTTVLAGAAGSSRLMADSLAVMGIIDARDFKARLRFIRIFLLVSLALYAAAYWLFEDPPQMLKVTSSLIAAIMFPILGVSTLYLRYAKVDPRIKPSPWTTACLWVSSLALIVISPGGVLLAWAVDLGWISLGG
jgi:Mn2+/Fe2+ NRAMP family transporter